nr:early light-induced protein 1, chloroplastic-like [Tanacetum cinerariifolium]
MAATSVFSASLVTTQFQKKTNTTTFRTIKCMSQPQDDIKPPSSATPTPTPINTPPPPPPPPPAPKVSTKFSDLLAFSGPAPERINGRLAMIGFVSALAVELTNGQDLFTQVSNGYLCLKE